MASTTLLATDLQRSLQNAIHGNRPYVFAYTPYGHRPVTNGFLSLLGFNGKSPDPVTGHCHLGNGYRQFNPVLMRFNSPDSWSPFGAGGWNAYAYCAGDPINNRDPSGHGLRSILRVNRPPIPPEPANHISFHLKVMLEYKPYSPKRGLPAILEISSFQFEVRPAN